MTFARLVIQQSPRSVGAWIGYPIEDADGIILGTFCLMDADPREWNHRDILAVATLARAVSTAIALRRALG